MQVKQNGHISHDPGLAHLVVEGWTGAKPNLLSSRPAKTDVPAK